MNNGEPWQTPLVTKHLFIFIVFQAQHCKPDCRATRQNPPLQCQRDKNVRDSPQETIICDGGERLWILNDPFPTVGCILYQQKSKNKNPDIQLKHKRSQAKKIMFPQSYLGQWSYISESTQNLCTLIHYIFCNRLLLSWEINNETSKHHWCGPNMQRNM